MEIFFRLRHPMRIHRWRYAQGLLPLPLLARDGERDRPGRSAGRLAGRINQTVPLPWIGRWRGRIYSFFVNALNDRLKISFRIDKCRGTRLFQFWELLQTELRARKLIEPRQSTGYVTGKIFYKPRYLKPQQRKGYVRTDVGCRVDYSRQLLFIEILMCFVVIRRSAHSWDGDPK